MSVLASTQPLKVLCVIFLLVSMLGSCSLPQRVTSVKPSPEDFPEARYLELVSDPQNRVYKIDSRSSKILAQVYRGGVMASLGHDHIVASQNVIGYLALLSNGECYADFFVPLHSVVVDDLQLRRAAQLQTTPSPRDIEGTKANMHASLDSQNFPFAWLHSDSCNSALSEQPTLVDITIHGVLQRYRLAISVKPRGDQFFISGHFSLLQTDFGIEPFSIFNGLLKVQDKVDIVYSLLVKRLEP
jgi:hypothetical protein